MHNNKPNAILTAECRLSYPNLFKKVAPYGRPDAPEDEWTYGCELLLPKTATACFEDIKKSCDFVIAEAVAGDWKGAKPNPVPVKLYDGDAPKKDGTPRGDECKGHWIIRLKGKRKPQVRSVYAIGGPDLTEVEVYAGCYVRATFNIFAYNTAGNKGLTFILGNVLKTRDGEPLGGAATAESDFAGLEEEPAIEAIDNPFGM